MIFQSTFIIAGNNIQNQTTGFHHLFVQRMERFLQQILSVGTNLISSSSFQYTQNFDIGIIGIEILTNPVFEFFDQFFRLNLTFFFPVTILQKINKIPQFFQRILILNNLTGKHIQFKYIQTFQRIPAPTDLLRQYPIDLLLIFFDLHLDFFPELRQVQRIYIFQNQTQIQLCICRRTQFLRMYLI